MDITQALKDTENSLRDFIAATLRKAFGKTWIERCGVSLYGLKLFSGQILSVVNENIG
ncbi:MAG: hypothetical protein QOG23_4625 [Blastocatellia bacterium]|jgi:hypothetical protein|nr:hypothetical protein [Blastocatellia bacterium]